MDSASHKMHIAYLLLNYERVVVFFEPQKVRSSLGQQSPVSFRVADGLAHGAALKAVGEAKAQKAHCRQLEKQMTDDSTRRAFPRPTTSGLEISTYPRRL